ncbi:MAG: lactate racemase domain-containing protein [Lentisphaeria bacterium]
MEHLTLEQNNITREETEQYIKNWLASAEQPLRKVLLLPPDATRAHSQAGMITEIIYDLLAPECQVDIMPALGTHVAMEQEALKNMFGDRIPQSSFLVHNWRTEVEQIGEVPADYVQDVSGGKVAFPIEIEVNKNILDPSYDLVVSIGQVVPHEVVGMANYTKNILVGCGGSNIINKSHFLGAAWGMEKLMGKDHSPVRKVLDYAEEYYLKNLPLEYILTVTSTVKAETTLHGLYLGRTREHFEKAVELSQEKNMTILKEPIQKAVVYLDPEEFKSTWLGNKAIYRTRMAMADDGELLIVGPGVQQFGEDEAIDVLVRKYGYTGTDNIIRAVEENADLRENLSAAAHLIHGSSEGRFTITYAAGCLTEQEVRNVGFDYMDVNEALAKYPPDQMEDGFTTAPDGEEIFYISNPALGLWASEEKFYKQLN